MRLIHHILVLLAASVFTACSQDFLAEPQRKEPLAAQGDTIELTGAISGPVMSLQTRGIAQVTNLTLLVFDEHHRYLYRAKAELVGTPRIIGGGMTNLPAQGNPAQENKSLNFKVTLISAETPRYVHFVANYDFPANFPDDYALRGADEGEVMPMLIDQSIELVSYWRSFRFDHLRPNTFNNHVFRLIRNEARVKLVIEQESDFELYGFNLYNAPDRGSVAPYYSKDKLEPTDPNTAYRDVLYSFPTVPSRPTLLPNTQIRQVGDVLTNKESLNTFEYSNSEAPRDKQVSIIMYGKRKNAARPGYYKIDLKHDLEDESNNFIGSEPYDVVRNYEYMVKVSSVATDGYATYNQAALSPAGNNLFSSVELQDFPEVTDGKYKLNVTNTEAIIIEPRTFQSQIFYTGDQATLEKVRIYVNRKPVATALNSDEFIETASFDQDTHSLKVKIKKIPTEGEKIYKFVVIADNGDTRNRSIIQRTITLTLRRRYDFRASLNEGAGANSATNLQGERVDLQFNVPGTIPNNLFPYEIIIKAVGLTPYVDATTNDRLKVFTKDGNLYYKYVVRTLPVNGQRYQQTLHFKRTVSHTPVSLELSSSLFNTQTINLP